MNNEYGYPQVDIDPKLKNYDWILQFVKAAYFDSRGYTPSISINSGQSRMQEIKQYAMGRQPVNKYKKDLLPEDQQDKTWMSIDWSPIALLPKFREIAISRILQQRFDIQAFAVDPLAKSDEDNYFNEMKVKIMMREAAQQQGSDLANHPALAPQPNEPQDMEQLKMEEDYGYKHIMSMEAEELNTLISQNSNINELEKRTVEYLYDFGIGGYRNYIDENGMVHDEDLDPENLVLSYTNKNDFSDLTHVGVIKEVYVGDLAPFFTKEQLNKIVSTVAGKFGNASVAINQDLSNYWNKFKVLVLDFQFLSWNTTVYSAEVDKRGNDRFRKTKFSNLSVSANSSLDAQYNQSITDTGDNGQALPKFLPITRKVVYKCKWLLQTDFMYDYGLSENMIRKQSSWWDTKLDYILYSWNFYKMQFAGITERLIPLEDKACLLWYKMQNLANKIIPYIINMDLNSFEGIAMGKGGKDWTPAQAVDFLYQNFTAVYRSTDLLSKNPNYKPVSVEQTGQMGLFGEYRNEMMSVIEMMRQVSGLNEMTDGSTPNAKNLTATTETANISTNNALWLIVNARKQLMIRLADANIAKGQIAVKLGKVQGYRKALGQETVSFLQIDPNVSNHEFGIFLEDAPTDTQREAFIASLNQKEYAGLIEPEDRILVMSCRNLKQADIVLAYRIKKRKEAQQQNQLQVQQAQAQGNMQVAQATEQMKQQTIQMQLQGQLQIENVKGEWLYRIELMKKENDANEAKIQAQSKIVSNQVLAQAKTDSAHIAAGSHLVGTHLKGQADLLMTQMDNDTAKETAKKTKAA